MREFKEGYKGYKNYGGYEGYEGYEGYGGFKFCFLRFCLRGRLHRTIGNCGKS